MGYISSKSRLAIVLSKLKGFRFPKVSNEQYLIDSEIGAFVLWNCFLKGDLMGKECADLGCGTGLLGIGGLLLGAKKMFFVDNDMDALDEAKKNLKNVKSEFFIDGKEFFMCKDIVDFNIKVDTVIENPPFGTKVRHLDKYFLIKAYNISKVVYSFHLTGNKNFFERLGWSHNFTITDTWEFIYPLKASYGFHKKEVNLIKVSCLRFEKNKKVKFFK